MTREEIYSNIQKPSTHESPPQNPHLVQSKPDYPFTQPQRVSRENPWGSLFVAMQAVGQ